MKKVYIYILNIKLNCRLPQIWDLKTKKWGFEIKEMRVQLVQQRKWDERTIEPKEERIENSRVQKWLNVFFSLFGTLESLCVYIKIFFFTLNNLYINVLIPQFCMRNFKKMAVSYHAWYLIKENLLDCIPDINWEWDCNLDFP